MEEKAQSASAPEDKKLDNQQPSSASEPIEIGGPKGPEPTRFGDWEVAGRCSDF